MPKNKLTLRQLQYIELVCDSPEILADEEVLRLLNIRKNTLARWKNSQFIREEINKRLRNRTEERMPKVWAGLLERAEAGDVKAIKLLFQVRGELNDKSREENSPPPPKVELIIKNK